LSTSNDRLDADACVWDFEIGSSVYHRTIVPLSMDGEPLEDFSRAKALYEQKGLGSRVGWGSRPAVLVVDVTNAFTDPSSPGGADLSEVIDEINQLLDVARESRVPVIFTSIAYDDPDIEGGHWVRKIPALRVLRRGTPAVDVDSRLSRKPSEPLIFKCYTSSFFGTHLQTLLQNLGVDTLVVCGCSTSGCIRATACDAVQLGFRCIVPETAVGDRAEAPHRANLFDIDAKYADVMELPVVLEELQRIASVAQHR
jgi:maleamate amidohydrolase